VATPPPLADAVLVRRLRQRDRTAWDQVYAEYSPRLYAYAQRLVANPHDADDLVQETFVRALPRLDKLDPDTVELGPYLFTTLRNVFLKSVERRKRAEPVADVPEPLEPAPIEDDPERSTLLHGQQDEVRVANARLAPRQRLVLALRELEDKSYAEIGEVVGLNENAVAQLISRARESLRTELRLAQVDPSRLPEECRAFLPLLSRHLDGQLRGEQLARTLTHLEGCERCQEALDSMREAQRRYRTLLPLPWLAEDEAKAAIDAELTSAGYWSRPARRGIGARRRGAVLVAGAVLLGAGGAGIGAAVVLGSDDPAPAAAASTSAAPPTSAEPPAASPPPPPPVRSEATVTATKPAPPEATQPPPPAPPTSPVSGPQETEPPVAASTSSGEQLRPPPSPPPPAPPPPPPPSPPPMPPVDRTAPTVAILTRPPAETSDPSAVFSFQASEAGATFSCRLDGAAFAPCVSPAVYHGLPVGAHSFAVRARDKAGNTGAAATADWKVVPPPDVTPPTTTIVSASVSGPSATFQFTSSETGSTFACSLDGAAYAGCTSPRAYSGLQPGDHAFAVRATDPAGNTGAPATHTWTIAPPLPDLVITSLTRSGFTVTNVGTASAGPFVVSVTLIGTFSIPGLAPGQSATRTWSICRAGTLTAIADRGRVVTESNEDNNSRSVASTC
jgi:RNA polymerase sigma factor (sigma-70 family)